MMHYSFQRKASQSRYNPNKHHRRSIRLKGYDYSQSGAYFITICTQNREHKFGEIGMVVRTGGAGGDVGAGSFVGDVGAGTGACPDMILNDAGKMVQSVWDEIPQFYPSIGIDCFQIMPNHIHGIVVIHSGQSSLSGHPPVVAPTSMSLSDVVHRFKTLTTKKYIDGVKQNGWQSFNGKLWQRNYYEHIIRDERSLHRIRQYIKNNPMQWESVD